MTYAMAVSLASRWRNVLLMSVNLEDCLPVALRGSSPTFTRMAAGLSGAGVHRVEAAGGTFVLKLSPASEPVADWRRKLHAQQQAAAANLAPVIVHTDEARRAVLSAFVVDQSFPARYRNPLTHEAALLQLGTTLRRVHALTPPADAVFNEPRAFLADFWAGLTAGFSLPEFVRVGTVFLQLARRGGHPGATGAETLDGAPALVEIYQRLQAGTLNPATPDGQWALGLAMVKTSAALS
jgi:hypothetical protein